MFCSRCGKDAGESNFCMHCGHKIGDVSSVNSVESGYDFFDKVLFIKKGILENQELAEARFKAAIMVSYILAIAIIAYGLCIMPADKYDLETITFAKQIKVSGVLILIPTYIFSKLKQPISMIVIMAINFIGGIVGLLSGMEFDWLSGVLMTMYAVSAVLFYRTIKDTEKSDKKISIYIANICLALFAFFELYGFYLLFSNSSY